MSKSLLWWLLWLSYLCLSRLWRPLHCHCRHEWAYHQLWLAPPQMFLFLAKTSFSSCTSSFLGISLNFVQLIVACLLVCAPSLSSLSAPVESFESRHECLCECWQISQLRAFDWSRLSCVYSWLIVTWSAFILPLNSHRSVVWAISFTLFCKCRCRLGVISPPSYASLRLAHVSHHVYQAIAEMPLLLLLPTQSIIIISQNTTHIPALRICHCSCIASLSLSPTSPPALLNSTWPMPTSSMWLLIFWYVLQFETTSWIFLSLCYRQQGFVHHSFVHLRPSLL